MGRENRKIGKIGERFALEFLKRRGYKILEMNFRTPFGEIDIIAKNGGVTVFIEVKTRSTYSLGPPALSVTKAKQRHIIKNAFCYLKRYNLVYSYWRIDIISVNLNHEYGLEDIEIIKNAVEENY